MPAFTVYIILEFSMALLFSVIFTVNALYQVTVVKLNPLQLVLVGTTLEASIFLFEIPTGILADVKSRRLSVIIGYVIAGIGFIVEASVPEFWAVALGQALWGLGYTFTSGATQAWIADEIGPERAGQAFLRGAQAAQIGALVGIPLSVLLGRGQITLPIILGGVGLIALAGFLAAAMPETGFTPTPKGERSTFGQMFQTVRDARQMTRRQPVILALLGIGLFFGMYSEGFDRLWTPHLLQNFAGPWGGEAEPVVWFGVIRAAAFLLSLAATEAVRRRVDTAKIPALSRVLTGITALMVVALAGFGLAGSFWLALALYWAFGALRAVREPLHNTWLNGLIDSPQVRATLFSASSQVDAIGQIIAGPAVGMVGSLLSIRAALATSAAILSPAAWLYARAGRKGKETGASF
jgi:DHA3 family tetracycline resistance protein-like MFS transporter